MFGLANFRCGIARGALRVDQFCRVDKLTTAITLVTLCVTIVAHRAFTLNEAISQEALALFAVLLIDNFLEGFVFSDNIFEDSLRNFSLLGGGGTAKSVEVAVEPIVDLFMNGVVVIANLLASFALLHSFGLSCSAVLVSTAHVNSVVAGKTCIPGEDIA